MAAYFDHSFIPIIGVDQQLSHYHCTRQATQMSLTSASCSFLFYGAPNVADLLSSSLIPIESVDPVYERELAYLMFQRQQQQRFIRAKIERRRREELKQLQLEQTRREPYEQIMQQLSQAHQHYYSDSEEQPRYMLIQPAGQQYSTETVAATDSSSPSNSTTESDSEDKNEKITSSDGDQCTQQKPQTQNTMNLPHNVSARSKSLQSR